MSRLGELDCLAHASRWRARHPAEKTAIAGTLLLSALVVPAWPGPLLVLLAAGSLTCHAAPLHPLRWLRSLAVPALFIAASTLPLLIVRPDQPALPLATGLRALAGAAGLHLLVVTTPAHDLTAWLHRLPRARILADVAAAMCDFIFLLAAQTARLQTAQSARLGYAGPAATLRSSALLAAHLLPAALARARRRERGLQARCGHDSLATQRMHAAPDRRRIAAAAAFLLGACLWSGLAAQR